MRQVVQNNAEGTGFNVDAAVWFDTITKKIEALKKIEDSLAADLGSMATVAVDASAAGLRRVVGTVAFALMLSLILVIVVSCDVLRSINGSLDMAKKMAKGDLDHQVSRYSKDEAG